MKKVIISLIMMFGIISSTSFAGTLVINTDTSDAAPKEAFEYIIKKFEEENPDVTVLKKTCLGLKQVSLKNFGTKF